tara:strand:+ start:85 stop:234 length:150 start_codon:yes stop_codon:yes gene_type:complete
MKKKDRPTPAQLQNMTEQERVESAQRFVKAFKRLVIWRKIREGKNDKQI